MSKHDLFYGIIDYDVKDDCKFLMLFCQHTSTDEIFIKNMTRETKVEQKFLSHLKIYNQSDAIGKIPHWFIDFNKDRYNGEGIFKEYYSYPVIDEDYSKPTDVDTLTFCEVKYFATGEGYLQIYMATPEKNLEKVRNQFQEEMKVDDYFMIGFDITTTPELKNEYPDWFINMNKSPVKATRFFQTYQNLS